MPLTREQKAKIVDELKEKFSQKKAAFFVSFTGVNVKASQELRKSLKQRGGEYKVVKKTLLARVLDEVNILLPPEVMQGQLAIAFDYGSEVQGAKILSEFTKRSNLVILGGLVGDAFFSGEKIKELALLPSIEILRARLLGLLQSPITHLLDDVKRVHLQFINLLKAIASAKR